VKLTFVDACLLIAAARGGSELATRAMAVLDDPSRQFSSSIFVKLETVPKATHFKREEEKSFYDEFFADVATWAIANEALANGALEEACESGLSACDSLHVVAAKGTKSAELVTAEAPHSALFRTKIIPIVTIRP
jgi:hypothetical protein